MSRSRRIDREKTIALRRAPLYGKKNDRSRLRLLSLLKRRQPPSSESDDSSGGAYDTYSENGLLRRRRRAKNAFEAGFVYSDNNDCWINAVKDDFEHTPRSSVVMAKESTDVCLADLAVEPLEMLHVSASKHGDACHFPLYTLTDTKNGRVFKFFKYVSGGKAHEPDGACVTAYQDDGGRVVIVKTLPAEDVTNEAMLVHQVTQLRQCLNGAMVNARLARVAQEPGCNRSSCDPKHYSVVLMHYAGQPLTTLDLKMNTNKAMFVTRGVALTCLRLYENGFVYSDMKPANVLYAGLHYKTMRLTLCDYGGLAALGATDAVSTYPPPEHPFGTNVHAAERVVVYGLGVLLVCLFTADLEYSLRFLMKRENKKKVKCQRENGRVHTRTADAVLAMQMACDKVIGALRAQDEGVARIVQLAWRPKTTIQELIAAIDAESSAHELETMEPASPEAKTPASPEIKSSQSDFSDD
jgi:hypothetical protein